MQKKLAITQKHSSKKTKTRENITIIPARFNDTFKRVTKKETYCKLVMLADDTGTIIIRLKQLADFLNTSDKTISKNLIELHNSGLIIKGKTFDQYGYQAMMIHIIDYNKLSENDTTSNQNMAGKILNKQFYETRVIHENEKDIHETWNNFYDTEKIIHETESPLIEEQKNDIKNTNVKQKTAREQAVNLSNQSSLPSHKQATSVSDTVSYISEQKNAENIEYLVRIILSFGTNETQARQMIQKYSYDVVLDKVNYVRSRDGIDNKGGYLLAVLKAYGRKNGLSSNKKPTPNNTQHSMEQGESRAEIHWREGKKLVTQLLQDKNIPLESLLNGISIEYKPTILEFLEIFNSYPHPCPGKPIDELLEGKNITLPVLKQKLQENLSIIESIESPDNTKDAKVFSGDNHSGNVRNTDENVQSQINDVQSQDTNVQSQSENVQSQKAIISDTKESHITQRQQEILDYIRVNKNVDRELLENAIAGVNEKTIRRDIKHLLDQGFIRWEWHNRKKVYRLR